MKTTEQIRQEVLNYLDKTSNHVFLKPDSTYVGQGPREYNYEKGSFFKIIKKEDGYYTFNSSFINDKIRKFDIESCIKVYGSNAKCVIKHSLFINKKMKSVKNNKHIQELIDKSNK